MKTALKRELRELAVLMRSIPPLTLTFFVLSVVMMNLFANKSIISLDWIALDCGIAVSWLSFLTMDIIVKHFGMKASNTVTIVTIFINLGVSAIFALVAAIPGEWSASYVEGSERIINDALDMTLYGSWFILFGSSVAFFLGGVVNNALNTLIGAAFKNNDGWLAYCLRSYVSTIAAQFVDNLGFALIVSLHFFGWTLRQCFVCAAIGAVVELFWEVVFSPIGYVILKKWKRDNIGTEYLKLRAEQ